MYSQPAVGHSEVSRSPQLLRQTNTLFKPGVWTHPYVNGNGRSFPLGSEWEARLAHLHRALSHDQQMVQTCGLFGVHFSATPASTARLFGEIRTNYQSLEKKTSLPEVARHIFPSFLNPLGLCSSLGYVLMHMCHFNGNTAPFHSKKVLVTWGVRV